MVGVVCYPFPDRSLPNDRCQISVQDCVQTTIFVGPQLDPIDELADDLNSLDAALWRRQRFGGNDAPVKLRRIRV
jgi:hypothetical protein